MYLNDDDLKIVIDEINNVGLDNKKLFIMEPISCMESRLTLKDFYSDGLEADYNAIYRTKDEYLSFFKDLNYNSIYSDFLFEDLSDHDETKYMFFVIG